MVNKEVLRIIQDVLDIEVLEFLSMACLEVAKEEVLKRGGLVGGF